MKFSLAWICLFGYLITHLQAQELLHCEFKIMAAKEQKRLFSKEVTISQILPYPINSIPENIISINSKATQKSVLESPLFDLEFSLKDDHLKIVLYPSMYDEKHTLAKISLQKLAESEKNQDTYYYKLFVPIELKNSRGRKTYIHGLEVGPCSIDR